MKIELTKAQLHAIEVQIVKAKVLEYVSKGHELRLEDEERFREWKPASGCDKDNRTLFVWSGHLTLEQLWSNLSLFHWRENDRA